MSYYVTFPSGELCNARRRRKGSRNVENSKHTRNTANTEARRALGGSRSANGAGEKDAPSDAVLAEALSGTSPERQKGGELAPNSGNQLQRNVEEALEHAGAEPANPSD